MEKSEEKEVEEESLGEDIYEDDGTSVLSDILDNQRAEVWGEVLVAMHLMQGGCQVPGWIEETQKSHRKYLPGCPWGHC